MHKLIATLSLAATLAVPAARTLAADQDPNYPQQEPPAQQSGAQQSADMEHRKMAGDEFASLDQNRDGKITPEEIPSDDSLSSQFAQIDTDSNGSLSKREFAKHHQKMMKEK